MFAGGAVGSISCNARNIGYMGIGLGMLVAGGVLAVNASVTPLATLQVRFLLLVLLVLLFCWCSCCSCCPWCS